MSSNHNKNQYCNGKELYENESIVDFKVTVWKFIEIFIKSKDVFANIWPKFAIFLTCSKRNKCALKTSNYTF